MAEETSAQIRQRLDDVVKRLGFADFSECQARLATGSVLFLNLGALVGELATIESPDKILGKLMASDSEEDQERNLKFVNSIENDVLPLLKKLAITFANMLPDSPGGRPRTFADTGSMRAVCDLVLKLINDGCSEAAAKRQAAIELETSPQTVARIWNRRVELRTDINALEVFSEIIDRLAQTAGVQWDKRNWPKSEIPEPLSE